MPLTARRPVMRLALDDPGLPRGVRRQRVGLLGGSFNPAHAGHRYLSLQAVRRLALDQVWWLVSPQNPLKPAAGMAPLAERMRRAVACAAHPAIRVLDLEARIGTRYTIDTLRRLCRRHDTSFVWLLGADNLQQLPRWRHWQEILRTVPVAVFERPTYSYGALVGKAASCFAGARVDDDDVRDLVTMAPPAWAFIRLRAHPASSTAIRRGAGGVSSMATEIG